MRDLPSFLHITYHPEVPCQVSISLGRHLFFVVRIIGKNSLADPKRGGGAAMGAPSTVQFLSFSCTFQQKSCQSVRFLPLRAPPPS